MERGRIGLWAVKAVLLAWALSVTAAHAATVTVQPATSTGDYTVSWPTVAGARSYLLSESDDTTWMAYTTVDPRKQFTGKAAGTYTYTVAHCVDIGPRVPERPEDLPIGCSATGYATGTATVVDRVPGRPAAPTVSVVGASNPNFAATTFDHTALGELRTRTGARGTTTWEYDALGRPERRTDPGVRLAGVLDQDEYRTDPGGGVAEWDWNPLGTAGALGGRSYDDGTSSATEFEETYAYDAYARRTGATATIRTTATDAVTLLRGFDHDAYGWLDTATHPAAGTAAEAFVHDGLGRLKSATAAYAGADGSTATRTPTYGYDDLGNVTSRTGGPTSYAYGDAARPTRLTGVTLDGVATTLAYEENAGGDATGHVEKYDAATGDDRFVSWNGRGLPTAVTLGASAATATPTARDEFRYGPDGERYYRKTTWTEETTDAAPTCATNAVN